MKILLIGAGGDVGHAIAHQIGARHNIIGASRRTPAPYRVDLGNSASIGALLEQCKDVESIIVAAGESHFGPIDKMQIADFRRGLEGKLLGQIEVALQAQHFLPDCGSITLTTGMIGEIPIRYCAAAAAVNGAIEAFVQSAAAELPRSLRINAVSPGLLESSVKRIGQYFLGMEPIAPTRIARAYERSLEGIETGRIFRVR